MSLLIVVNSEDAKSLHEAGLWNPCIMGEDTTTLEMSRRFVKIYSKTESSPTSLEEIGDFVDDSGLLVSFWRVDEFEIK